jgi:membrane-bound ClpP family serine protease
MKENTMPESTKDTHARDHIPLGRQNYLLMLSGIVVIIIGFILMSGGRYTEPDVFNPEELFSTRRITIAPIVVLLGFAIEIYAIFHKKKD